MKWVLLIALLGSPSLRGESSLAAAVQKSDRSLVKSLLAQKVDLNAATPDGMTPLHWAAHQNDLDTAQLLVKAGADVKSTNRYAITPLFLACENRNHALVHILLEAGADPNTRQRGGDTVLMVAARTGHKEIAQALVAKGADVNARDKTGQTAIMWAAAEGHSDLVDLLIQSGADFRTPLDGGFTPFFFAIREGRGEVVKRLIEAGLDVNEPIQPKRRAGRGPQPGLTPLLMAVENGHYDLAIALVQESANPNDDRGGYTALHSISWIRKPELGEGEDAMPPPTGSGQLHSLQFVRKLVALGANPNARMPKSSAGLGALNRTGATPFLMAAKTADIALLKLLYELGADPSIPTAQGVTPLIVAAGLGTLAAGEVAGTEEEVLETLAWLLTIGADINAVDQNGETAMHAAAYKNLPKVVEFLAAHGAKIDIWNQKNKHGWTPLLIAEGFRPGNFKPSFETIAALHKIMLASGVQPPPPTSAEGINNSDFGPRERKYIAK